MSATSSSPPSATASSTPRSTCCAIFPARRSRGSSPRIFRPARRTAVNAFLVYSAGRLALIDTGCGGYLTPTTGKLLANLKAAGVDPADIDTVLLTHVHPDHSGALVDMTTGKRNFPNAELVMHENEIAHWFDDAKMAAGSEREKRLFFQAGRDQLAPYKDRWRLFKSGEVFPGVTAIPRPGHTPGHTTYMISSGNEQLLIWGDTIHVQELQTAHPEVCLDFDVTRSLPSSSRRQVFDMVATDKLLFTGMHMHFPRPRPSCARRHRLQGDSDGVGADAVRHLT